MGKIQRYEGPGGYRIRLHHSRNQADYWEFGGNRFEYDRKIAELRKAGHILKEEVKPSLLEDAPAPQSIVMPKEDIMVKAVGAEIHVELVPKGSDGPVRKRSKFDSGQEADTYVGALLERGHQLHPKTDFNYWALQLMSLRAYKGDGKSSLFKYQVQRYMLSRGHRIERIVPDAVLTLCTFTIILREGEGLRDLVQQLENTGVISILNIQRQDYEGHKFIVTVEYSGE